METKPVITLEPSRGLVSLNLRDLWEYRELLFFLTWRDIKVRYKQTVLGAV
jgi:lipopolysaccharide transport system permease protein